MGIGGVWGLGCVACASLPASRTAGIAARRWAQFTACRKSLSRWILRRHAQTNTHRAAVLLLLGVQVGPTGGCVVGAPGLDEFQLLLSQMEDGGSERASARRITGAACSTKVRRMRWCHCEGPARIGQEVLGDVHNHRPVPRRTRKSFACSFWGLHCRPPGSKRAVWPSQECWRLRAKSWSVPRGSCCASSARRSGQCQQGAEVGCIMTGHCSVTSKTALR